VQRPKPAGRTRLIRPIRQLHRNTHDSTHGRERRRLFAVRLTAVPSLSCWQALPAALQARRLMSRLSRSYRSKGCSWARKMSPAWWRSPFFCHKRPAPALRRKPAQSLLRSRIFFRTCQFPFKNGQGTDFRSARLQFIRPAGFHHEKDAHQPVGILRMAENPPAAAVARFSRRAPRKKANSRQIGTVTERLARQRP
jgi:hypothetical protein